MVLISVFWFILVFSGYAKLLKLYLYNISRKGGLVMRISTKKIILKAVSIILMVVVKFLDGYQD